MASARNDKPGLGAPRAGLAPDGYTLFSLGSPEGPAGGEARGFLLHGSRLVNEARASHRLGPLESWILAQAYLAAGLMGATLKGSDRVALRLDGDGPAEGFSVEASGVEAAPGEALAVELRGYLFRDIIELPHPLERLDTLPLFGKGSLTAIRFSQGAALPFTGTISLGGGGLAQDLATYWLESEQQRTALVIGVEPDRAGGIAGAAALLLQALPGAREATMERAESAIASLPPLGAWFAGGGEAGPLLAGAFSALGLAPRGSGRASFACHCSRERFASFLAGAEGGLLEELIRDGPWPAEAHCHNCGRRYEFPRAELEAMLAARPR